MQPRIDSQGDSSRYRLFLTTNEAGQSKTIQNWKKLGMSGNTIIGVSGFFTLNLASQLTPTETKLSIVMLDLNPKMKTFWENIEKSVLESDDCKTCALKIVQHVSRKENAAQYFPDGFADAEDAIQQLQAEIKEKQSWLSCNQQFAQIKEIFANQRFHFKQIDLCKTSETKKLIQFLNEKELRPDTLYLSNVKEYAYDEGKIKGYTTSLRSLKGIMNKDAKLIDTAPRDDGSKPLKQRLVLFKPKEQPLSGKP